MLARLASAEAAAEKGQHRCDEVTRAGQEQVERLRQRASDAEAARQVGDTEITGLRAGQQQTLAEVETLKAQCKQDAAVLASLTGSLQAALAQQQQIARSRGSTSANTGTQTPAEDGPTECERQLRQELACAGEASEAWRREAADVQRALEAAQLRVKAAEQQAATYLSDLEVVTQQLAHTHNEHRAVRDELQTQRVGWQAKESQWEQLEAQLRGKAAAAGVLLEEIAAAKASLAGLQATHQQEVTALRVELAAAQQTVLQQQQQRYPVSHNHHHHQQQQPPGENEEEASCVEMASVMCERGNSSIPDFGPTCAAVTAGSLRSSLGCTPGSVKQSQEEEEEEAQPHCEDEEQGETLSSSMATRIRQIGALCDSPVSRTSSVVDDATVAAANQGPRLRSRAASQASEAEASPGICISMSGFKPNLPGYDMACKNEQVRLAQSLGFKVHTAPAFTSDITHVVSPPGCRTLKVLGATLMGRWVVTTGWLVACAEAAAAGEDSVGNPASACAPLLSPGLEARFGYTYDNPFRTKRFFVTEPFRTESRTSPQCKGRLANVKVIIEEYSNGLIVDCESEADFVLMADSEAGNGPRYVTFTQFVEMIPFHTAPQQATAAAAPQQATAPEALLPVVAPSPHPPPIASSVAVTPAARRWPSPTGVQSSAASVSVLVVFLFCAFLPLYVLTTVLQQHVRADH